MGMQLTRMGNQLTLILSSLWDSFNLKPDNVQNRQASSCQSDSKCFVLVASLSK